MKYTIVHISSIPTQQNSLDCGALAWQTRQIISDPTAQEISVCRNWKVAKQPVFSDTKLLYSKQTSELPSPHPGTVAPLTRVGTLLPKCILIRGNHTNNFAEVGKKIIELVFSRVKAYNLVHVFNFLSETLESEYYCRKLLSVANNRLNTYIALRFQGLNAKKCQKSAKREHWRGGMKKNNIIMKT